MEKRAANILLVVGLLMTFSCKSKKQSAAAPETPAAILQNGSTVGLNLGNKAPEITLKNFNDSVIPLSSVTGKLVLIDFWASWCGPCRLENPYLVEDYKKYKDKNFKGGKGFTIYSVSLDGDRAKWRAAIEKDGLVWPYHVSDLKMWSSEMVTTYDVKGIPTNVLINDKGIIIGKNLRGDALGDALDKQVIKDK